MEKMGMPNMTTFKENPVEEKRLRHDRVPRFWPAANIEVRSIDVDWTDADLCTIGETSLIFALADESGHTFHFRMSHAAAERFQQALAERLALRGLVSDVVEL